jgi:hypothetical protein
VTSRDRAPKRLAVAVLDQAIRDAELVEVEHRVPVCRLEAWPSLARLRIYRTRLWLVDPELKPDSPLVFWTQVAGISVTAWTRAIWTRIEWTRELESQAPDGASVPRSSRGWSDSPYRREGDNA